MTILELRALADLLIRTPMTMAERCWVADVLNRETTRVEEECANTPPAPPHPDSFISYDTVRT